MTTENGKNILAGRCYSVLAYDKNGIPNDEPVFKTLEEANAYATEILSNEDNVVVEVRRFDNFSDYENAENVCALWWYNRTTDEWFNKPDYKEALNEFLKGE